MAYRIDFRASADKSMDKLSRDVQRRIISRIAALADHPRPSGCVKLSGPANLWRIRIGDYRVVYELDDPTQSVTITIIAHRRESYRGL